MNKEELLKKFEIQSVKDEIEPHYIVNITMDENDADYKNISHTFTEEQWNDLPLVVLLCLSYCAKGSFVAERGKFNVDGWNGYGYGHHITENEDFPWIVDIMNEFGMIEFSSYDGYCHSYEEIRIEYIDKDGVKHDVKIPDFDELFNSQTKDEMIAIMNSAYAEAYVEHDEN